MYHNYTLGNLTILQVMTFTHSSVLLEFITCVESWTPEIPVSKKSCMRGQEWSRFNLGLWICRDPVSNPPPIPYMADFPKPLMPSLFFTIIKFEKRKYKIKKLLHRGSLMTACKTIWYNVKCLILLTDRLENGASWVLVFWFIFIKI